LGAGQGSPVRRGAPTQQKHGCRHACRRVTFISFVRVVVQCTTSPSQLSRKGTQSETRTRAFSAWFQDSVGDVCAPTSLLTSLSEVGHSRLRTGPLARCGVPRPLRAQPHLFSILGTRCPDRCHSLILQTRISTKLWDIVAHHTRPTSSHFSYPNRSSYSHSLPSHIRQRPTHNHKQLAPKRKEQSYQHFCISTDALQVIDKLIQLHLGRNSLHERPVMSGLLRALRSGKNDGRCEAGGPYRCCEHKRCLWPKVPQNGILRRSRGRDADQAPAGPRQEGQPQVRN
jgi:hypothetical protein